MAEVESIKSDVLPYDFVKENEVIVSETTMVVSETITSFSFTKSYGRTSDLMLSTSAIINQPFL